MFEIVIARYNEDISWAEHATADRITVYNKGGSDNPWENAIDLPNVGREAHTYLTHIIERWDDLADVTAFLLGSAMKHVKSMRIPIELYNVISQDPNIPISVAGLGGDPDWPGRIKHHGRWLEQIEAGLLKRASLDMGDWYDAMGLPQPRPGRLLYNPAAFFSVAREYIKKRPIDFYKQLLETVSDHNNPEEAHYLERMWVYVFGGRP